MPLLFGRERAGSGLYLSRLALAEHRTDSQYLVRRRLWQSIIYEGFFCHHDVFQCAVSFSAHHSHSSNVTNGNWGEGWATFRDCKGRLRIHRSGSPRFPHSWRWVWCKAWLRRRFLVRSLKHGKCLANRVWKNNHWDFSEHFWVPVSEQPAHVHLSQGPFWTQQWCYQSYCVVVVIPQKETKVFCFFFNVLYVFNLSYYCQAACLPQTEVCALAFVASTNRTNKDMQISSSS